jgi:phthalate 4,5-dioxygenase
MLSAQDNELLTRVGPGTPMGELMRQYWIPACGSNEITSGGPPLRLLLLGEKLIAFRDDKGKVGIFDHRCPHRCASLFFGRNEKDGLRCVYHGWKFDTDGNCLETPNVPPHLDFKSHVRAKAYKAFEHNGLVWAYMGPSQTPPPPPAMETMFLPADEVQVGFTQRRCNWLQGLEGEIDTAHFGFLHLGSVDVSDVDETNMHVFAIKNKAPDFHVSDADWGTMYAAYRPADPGNIYYRFAHFMFPFWSVIPDGTFEDNIIAGAWVPMDDHHTMTTYMSWSKRSQPLRTLKNGEPIPGLNFPTERFLPNTSDWYGRFLPAGNSDNDYLIDREAQRNSSFSGIVSVGLQDQAIVESMGAIVDRTLEHLAPSDRMIGLTRRRLLHAVRALQVEGTSPPGAQTPECYRDARGGSLIAPEGPGWMEVYQNRLRQSQRATGPGVAAE